jgi:hypothetical protein
VTAFTRRAAAALAVVLVASTLAACGGSRVQGTAGKQIKQLPPDLVPVELLGLPVTQEDMSGTVARSNDAFVDAVGLYAMRRDELLYATLQVSRFRSNAPVKEAKFRSSLITQIGGSTAEPFRMGADTVYRTTGRKQTITVWFRDRYMFVLSVRESFEQPRSLLRQALEVKPA